MKKSIEAIAAEDGRYNAMAIKFVYEGLGVTIQKIRNDQLEKRHISGDQLSRGLADLAMGRWGRLARMVLNRWGVNTTRDLGEIVYLMITNNWMTAQQDDTIDDFDDVYDFENVFEKDFKFESE
jgi:uncharacterized repeat protein (TIGR04138 family)